MAAAPAGSPQAPRPVLLAAQSSNVNLSPEGIMNRSVMGLSAPATFPLQAHRQQSRQRGHAKVRRKNAKPSSASASWVSASGRQMAAARAIVLLSGVKDSMTTAPS